MEMIEDEVLTAVNKKLLAELGSGNFYLTSEYNPKPPKFPCVYIHEADNFNAGFDGCNHEVVTGVMYEAEVLTNKTSGKKTQAKQVMEVIDSVLTPLGLKRTFMQQIPNMADATIFRLLARYSGAVINHTIYRR